MRAALAAEGAPADVLQCIERPSIPLANELMAIGDLTIATGGPAMVKAAYGSGKPAYGVGAGNATMVIDETADIDEAARNSAISKTNDHGSGCSADGNLRRRGRHLRPLPGGAAARGRLPRRRRREDAAPRRPTGTSEGRRTADTIARPAAAIAAKAGIALPAGKTLLHRRGAAHRPAAPVLHREARRRARPVPATAASTTPSTRCGRSSRPAARATPAASTRSTTSTSIGWRSPRR